MKILLGGVPFGCDNIGDEAILNCVVKIFRRLAPEAELTVATGDPATAKRLGVATVPLYGFSRDYPAQQLCEVLSSFDLYVWSGATGLSDYPDTGCALLEAARAAGVPGIVWNVGMNDRLNPAFFRLGGIRRRVAACFGLVGFFEARREQRVRERIAGTLGNCKLVVVRDQPSLTQLHRCGTFPDAVSGADSAILQEDSSRLAPYNGTRTQVGICLSAQNALRELDGFARFLDRLIEETGCRILFIPMNPVTDRKLMESLREKLVRRADTAMVTEREPEEIQSIAGQCDLIISSRLHLMILGLNRLVPAIGIARGSKIPTFLEKFGLPTVGNTERCDLKKLYAESLKLLENKETFQNNARPIREKQLSDLADAERLLCRALSELAHH